MAIYSTLYGLPQSMVDYLNQGLPRSHQQYVKYGPRIPTQSCPQVSRCYSNEEDIQFYTRIDPNENADILNLSDPVYIDIVAV
jgi:hypothetical protein